MGSFFQLFISMKVVVCLKRQWQWGKRVDWQIGWMIGCCVGYSKSVWRCNEDQSDNLLIYWWIGCSVGFSESVWIRWLIGWLIDWFIDLHVDWLICVG